jgi:hypothetical protein
VEPEAVSLATELIEVMSRSGVDYLCPASIT